ncbi:hypothetical protein K491DRAFT_719891 [Lophiostoma macrostomum CBS 122681]|uniref:C2H2-type domain-containing protein n=1 Tax=Lophiostoma macrostomum CBS 122681 TaxID=1314788 RepID=A0A6A6SUS1_9PLEO|nr:hypothetical protein K491DRAFT_719891 [Lophiostoma macrostomum CBS 122681]
MRNDITIGFNNSLGLVCGTDLAFFAVRIGRRTFGQLSEYSQAADIFTTLRASVPYIIWRYPTTPHNTRNKVFAFLERLNLLELPVARQIAKQWDVTDVMDAILGQLSEPDHPRRLRCWACHKPVLVGLQQRSRDLVRHVCYAQCDDRVFTTCLECSLFFLTQQARVDHQQEYH